MSFEPIRVLLIEDSPADARLLVEALREADAGGFRVEHAARLEPAETSLAIRKPDVIALDLTLPESSGLETVRRIRSAAPGVPIVVLTGMQDERLALEAVRMGVQDYLVKGQEGLSPARSLRYAVERRRIEESLWASEERFRLLVEGVKDYAIMMLDAQGHVASWNEGAKRITGYEESEIKGRHFSCLFTRSDASAGKPEAELRRATQESHWTDENWRVRKDGTEFWADVVLTALRTADGALRGFAKVMRDFTEKKAIEIEHVRAKEAAEAANKAKDNFLSMLSHELRTPLTPVLAVASRLETVTDLPDELREDMGVIRRNVEIEARLIDDLLDLTRIANEKIQLHFEVVDVHALLQGALYLFRNQTQAKPLTTAVRFKAEAYHVWGDRGRLQQVFFNLISNAVKFTPAEGTVTLETSNEHTSADGARLVVSVIDSGIGIRAETLPRLFNAFEQGERMVLRQFGGLGLGLSIAKALVELHKGSICAASAGTDMGATLSVELDTIAAPTVMTPSIPPEVSKNPTRASRILLVEDHDDTRRVMSRLFKSLGCSVATAATVKEAIALADAQTFDLLVSDIGLPDGSGTEVMRYVKERYQLKGIALSGFGTDDDRRRSREAGFEEHLTKPIQLKVLDAAMRAATGFVDS